MSSSRKARSPARSRRAPARPQRTATRRTEVQQPGERVQKILSAAGIASRRAAEELIAAGRVTVDGRPASLGDRADPARSRIEVDGERVAVNPRKRYYALNKPGGVVTTASDPQGRRKVTDLVRSDVRLVPVGRLDAETTGLLLMTNDGELVHRLTHPRWQVPRVYVAEVRGEVSRSTLERLRRGVRLEDGVARAKEVKVAGRIRNRSRVEITMTQGRKREVRRMLETAGHLVEQLARVRYGPISLGGLRSGTARELTPLEVGALLRTVGL